ncbi:MAG TPA: hypothetical protein VI386_22015 [Candidatus Sulfotelmatobacter sp.]
MKVASSSIVPQLLIALALVALFIPAASAQTPQALNDNPGVDCLEYKLDIVTLKDNNHKMYWKQDDCIRIHVVNNPFLYTYTLNVGETKIAEDNILGSLSSLLGLKNITSAAAPTTPTTPETTSGTHNAEASKLQSSTKSFFEKSIPSKACTPQQEKAFLDSLAKTAADIRSRLADQEVLLRNLAGQASKVEKTLEDKENIYRAFQTEYSAARESLEKENADPESLRREATALKNKALLTSQILTGDLPYESSFVDSFNTAKVINNGFERLSTDVGTLNDQLRSPTSCNLSNGNSELAAFKARVKGLQDDIDKDVLELENYTAQIANTACKYKARKNGEFSWVYDQVYESLAAVLANKFAFGCSTEQRNGPYADPTAATLTLTRARVIDKSESSIPKADNSAFECSSDPATILQSKKPFETLAELPISQPTKKPGASTAEGGYPTAATTPKPPTQKTPDAEPKVVLVQPWSFGKARLVLTGGLTTGFLGKQEFQRSSAIAGSGSTATSSTVIGVKTDTRYRLSPMLYGHTLLYSGRHDSDAWYATFGVTANSDNKGTDPEFMLGISRSVAQQRFFLTLGSYIGQQQRLDGGLHVGQTIPSTLTGELPITKSYRASWGFGISYRFTSSKDPQKDTSTQPKPSTGGTKKPSS